MTVSPFLVNLVLLDIKSWDPELHRKLTNADIGPVLSFARRLCSRNRPTWLRFVLVPGLTDGVENIAHIARFAASLGNVERVDVLPFHQIGRFKWQQLGLNYDLDNVQPPSLEVIGRACTQFRADGLKVSAGNTEDCISHPILCHFCQYVE